jgi:hypothetical protein
MLVLAMEEMLVTVEALLLALALALLDKDKVPTWHLATDKDMVVEVSMRHPTTEVHHKEVDTERVLGKAWITFR